MIFAPSKSIKRSRIQNISVSKISDHIQIKIKMPNHNQEPPASSRAPSQDSEDIYVLCPFKVKIESQNLKKNIGVSKISDHIQIKIKVLNPSQEPPASSKAPNEDLKHMYVLCTSKIKKEKQTLYHGCIKDQWPYPIQDQDAKPWSETSSPHQSPKSGLKGWARF